MKSFALTFLFVVAAGPVAAESASTTAPVPAQSTTTTDPEADRLRRIQALPWKDVHALALPASRATLSEMPGFAGLAGEDARSFRTIVEGETDPTIEGDVVRQANSSEVIFSWHKVGYVDAKDFSDIEPDKLIESVRDATFAANQRSEQAGFSKITAVNWLRKPTWNEGLHTAFWMMEGVHEDGEHTVNAVALKLGRHGYEKMIWITSPDQIGKANDLALADDAHKYASGDRYEDHVSGDSTAAYGVAGLVAGVIGLKAAKVAGFGALLLLLKKFFVVLLVPFIWLSSKMKALFRRRNQAD